MKTATEVLRQEHEAILKMLDALERTATQMESGVPISVDVLKDLQEFFTIFADRCHHGKEEDLLFPLLEKKGMPRIGGPVGCMLVEHDQGRELVRAMGRSAEGCAAGDAAAKETWSEAARGYTNLLRNHIWKENEILFQLADRLMTEEDQATLRSAFEKMEEEKLGAGTHARLHEKMEKLAGEITASAG